MSVVRWAKRRGTGSWLALATKPPKLVAVALANGAHRLGAADEEGAAAGGRAVCRLKGFPGSALALDVGGKDGGRVRANGHGAGKPAALLVCHVSLVRSAYHRPRPAKPPRYMNVPDAPSFPKCLHQRGRPYMKCNLVVADRPFACCGEVRR